MLQALGAAAFSNVPVMRSDEPPADLTSMVSQNNEQTQYYRARHDDFVKRHPDRKPPTYYLEYGEKYARAFSHETYGKLSPQGKEWLNKTRAALQNAIEDLRNKDPAAFAELERNSEAFRRFAFKTHVDAYVDNGLMKLPLTDLAVIALTPEFKEFTDIETQKQVFGALWKGKGELFENLWNLPDLKGAITEALVAAGYTLPTKFMRETLGK